MKKLQKIAIGVSKESEQNEGNNAMIGSFEERRLIEGIGWDNGELVKVRDSQKNRKAMKVSLMGKGVVLDECGQGQVNAKMAANNSNSQFQNRNHAQSSLQRKQQ